MLIKRWREARTLFKRGRLKAPGRERDRLVSHILLHEGDVPEARLTVTWVDVAPGPGPGQDAGDEERTVIEGDVVFIPPRTVPTE